MKKTRILMLAFAVLLIFAAPCLARDIKIAPPVQWDFDKLPPKKESIVLVDGVFSLARIVEPTYTIGYARTPDTFTVTITDRGLAEVYDISANTAVTINVSFYNESERRVYPLFSLSNTWTGPGQFRIDSTAMKFNDELFANGAIQYDYANRNIIGTFKVKSEKLRIAMWRDCSLEVIVKYGDQEARVTRMVS